MKKVLLFIGAFILCLGINLHAQERTVTGKVVDDQGETLPGVSVLLKGTSTGVVTDLDGMYSISVPGDGGVLVFSFIGMQSQEVTIGSRTSIDVTLAADVQQLSEVVITSIGLERERKALGYSVQNVSSEELTQRSEPDPIRALTGKVAGVNIQGGGGAPGQSTKINIRGISSLTGNTQPLFVVDGIPFNNDVNAVGQGGASSFAQNSVTTNRAFDIDPNMIESMTVLKGAAAAALYGSRAANGVIVITTKSSRKSSKKGLEVTYNTSYAIEQIAGVPNYQDVYMQGSNQVYNGGYIGNWGAPFPAEVDRINAEYGTNYKKTVVADHLKGDYPDGYAPHPLVGIGRNYGQQKYFPDLLLYDADGNPRPLVDSGGDVVLNGKDTVYMAVAVPLVPHDNIGGFFQNGKLAENSLSITSAGSSSTLSATLSRTDNTGIVPNSGVQRTSIGFGGNSKLENGLFVSGNVNYVNTYQYSPPTGASYNTDYGSGGGGSIYSRLFYLPRNFDLNGYPWENPVNGDNVFYRALDNPLWLVNKNKYTSDVNRAFGNLALTYDIKEGISFTAKGGINTYTDNRKDFREYGGVAYPFGLLSTTQLTNTEVNFDFLLNFEKDISQDISFRGIVGHNVNQREFSYTAQEGSQLVVKGISNIENTKTQTAMQYYRLQRYYAYYADMQFGYKDYAYLNIQARNDISSTLPVGSRSYFYPSISTSFILTDMFDVESDFLDFAKLRLSYAQVGNEASPYSLITTYRVLPSFGGVNRLTLKDVLNNPELKNELTKEFEVGMDFRLMEGKINLDFTYFDRNSFNQITKTEIAKSSGFDQRIVNTGDIENKGIEVLLNTTPYENDDFSWNSILTYTRIRSLIVDSGIGGDIVYNPYGSAVDIIHRTGQPYGQIYGTRYARDNEGNLLIDASLGTPIVDAGKHIIGDPNPDFIAGWINTLTYKGFTLNMLLDWKQGGDMFSITAASLKLRGQLAYSTDREALRVVPGYYGDRQTKEPLLDENGQKIQNTTGITSFDWYFSDGFAAYGADEVNIYDATVIRLRELSLGYSIPKSVLEKTPFGTAKITLSGRNLWYNAPNFPKDLNFDPEVLGATADQNINGIDFGTTPTTRRYGVNLVVTF